MFNTYSDNFTLSCFAFKTVVPVGKYNNRVYVRGHKYVLGPTYRLILSLRRAQNIFMPKNINSITINIFLEGIEKIKTEKNDNKTGVALPYGLPYGLPYFDDFTISQ